MFFQNIWDIITKYYPDFLKGVGITVLLAITGTLFGLIIGLLIGVFRTLPKAKGKTAGVFQKIADYILVAYIEVFRGTPMMVQAMVIYYGYAAITSGQTLPVIPSAIIIVSINTGAYMAEIVRGGILSIDKGQFEGAEAIGMSHWQMMTKVIIPQVMRNILPSVGNEFVINIKDTSVLSVIYVSELFFMGKNAAADNYLTLETYVVVSVIYLILTLTSTRILRLLEKKLNGKEHYTICGSQSNPDANIVVNTKEEIPND
ncbi:MAG: amino acid ABC transporter permease [bacterium]|nr:amino acid ABC transporter permease [bacterium]